MIVHSYGRRRSRSIGRTFSDTDSLSQDTTPSQDFHNFTFSSQESFCFWSSSQQINGAHKNSNDDVFDFDDEENGAVMRSKHKHTKKAASSPRIAESSSLLEAQEFGEMMEHVDEVSFALDGLKKGQSVRIRRASLLSLLSISGSAQQRWHLRAQGTAKTILKAILGLGLDDTPSNLAAAALLYVLTSDGSDEHLLESPSCIHFLIKLLKPALACANEEKGNRVGYKLLALCKDTDILRDAPKLAEASSAAIISKVEEILVASKEMKLRSGNGIGTVSVRPELNPKWMALLTMEEACLSKIYFEDTTGAVRKTGGNFKEKLREHGGLDAVFEVAVDCHSVMEGWIKYSSSSNSYLTDEKDIQSLVLLLKCLKILENATILSKHNQNHLLQMKGNLDSHGRGRSFIKLVISIIKTLSELYLSKSYASSSKGLESAFGRLTANHGVQSNEIICISSGQCSSMDCSFFESSSSTSQNRSRAFGESYLRSKEDKHSFLEECEDPFAFDEDECEPSKWDLLSGKKKVGFSKEHFIRYRESEDWSNHELMMSQQESDHPVIFQSDSNNEEDHQSQEISGSYCDEEDNATLLSDCVLTAVKVLVNSTNDNPIGCQQIASCGGLETMTSLIAHHFPSFCKSLSLESGTEEDSSCIQLDSQNDKHLNDQELDLLVALLGLLVNLVEKDGQNRLRLAAARVSIRDSEGLEEESKRGVIPLLCAIFLANRGDGDAAGEVTQWDDETTVLEEEKEAAKMIVEPYSALLLAFLSTESRSTRNEIAAYLPNQKLAVLVPVLERFVTFHLSLDMMSPETHKTVSEVIQSCKIP